MIHIHIRNDSDAVWRLLYIITCTSVRSCGAHCGLICCTFRFCVNMLWMVGDVVLVPPDSLAHVHLRFISSNLLTRDMDLIRCCDVACRLPISVRHFPSHLKRHTPFRQQCSITKHIYKLCVILCDVVRFIHMKPGFWWSNIVCTSWTCLKSTSKRCIMIDTTKGHLKRLQIHTEWLMCNNSHFCNQHVHIHKTVRRIVQHQCCHNFLNDLSVLDCYYCY